MANKPRKKKEGAPATADILDSFKRAVDETTRQSMPSYKDGDFTASQEDIWINGDILSFAEFCTSSEHMSFPTLSDRQREVADHMFGPDPKLIFDNNRTTAVLLWGKGAGKDTISAMMLLYIVYVLLHLRDPQKFFDRPQFSSIDLINVAFNKEQAQEVYFDIIRNAVKNWGWLRKKWDIVMNGRYFSSVAEVDTDAATNKVTITNDAIIFPNNIRMFSGSSEADSMEGKNPIAWVLDEADAFKQDSISRSADRIYRVARTSSTSRYSNRFKGFIISYPRARDGFIMRMYERAKGNIEFYCDKAATWEVLPKSKYSAKTFEFEGKQIPMDFFNEFRLDPMFSKSAYLCEPPESENAFFEDSDRVDATLGRVPETFAFQDLTMHGLRKKEVIRVPHLPDRSIKYVLCFDLSEARDSTALALAHRNVDRIVVDFVTSWVPDQKTGVKVDLRNVEDVIEEVRKHVSVSKVAGDPWNSAILCQTLRSRGVNAGQVKIDMEDYSQFKRLVYAGHVDLPDNPTLINELKDLHVVSGRKVDHPTGKHNDLAVTVVMATKMLLDMDKTSMSTNMMAEGEYVGDNLHESVDAFDNSFKSSGEGLTIDGIEI